MEKYLKGRLIEEGHVFPKTHDLEKLLDLVAVVEPLWAVERPALASISDHAVEARYPGNIITPEQASEALKATTRIRKLIRSSLGLIDFA